MANRDWKSSFARGMLSAMNEGSVSIPHLLIKYYPRLELSDMEVMLLIHILTFKEKEQKNFPTIEELQSRMSSKPDEVIDALERLMKNKFLTIDEEIDQETGIQYENYNLELSFEKLVNAYVEELDQQEMDLEINIDTYQIPTGEKDIFSTFEKEFARPLSPMECETISGWMDQDLYSNELILTALKESVFAGKLHFRYIDRILLEWSRNRVRTVAEAKEYSQKFR